ncbi:MAG: cyclic nucleotide-binding domain-containing protein [Persicimonas sp.]
MKLRAWGKSDMGNVRSNNEDNYFIDVEQGVFVVADGVGGRDRGEVASKMVAEATRGAAGRLREAAEAADSHEDPDHRERVLDLVSEHLQEVNASIFGTENERGRATGMATTTDMLVVSDASAYVGHVGDSRVYLIRDDEIFRITEDHTYAEQLRRDQRSDVRRLAEQNEKFEHMLTRSMGGKPHVEIDTLYLDVQPGDRFVLCTDGLTDYLSGQEILEHAHAKAGEELLDALVDDAKDRGGRDNVTVVIVEAFDESVTPHQRGTRSIDTIRQVDFLEQIELFNDLTGLELIKVLRIVYERIFEDGEVILRRGDDSDALYLIVEGQVALSVDDAEITRLDAGQHFGEMALFDDDPTRSATATSVGDAVLLVIPADKFQRLISQELEIGNKLLTSLVRHAARQMRAMNERLASGQHSDTIRTYVPPEISDS